MVEFLIERVLIDEGFEFWGILVGILEGVAGG